jgi:hypothetical protein
MSETNSSIDEGRLTLFGRMTDHLLSRKPGRFIAELILIVAGILIALAIDGWVNDARDRDAEVVYLQLLARDVDAIRQRAEAQIDYEEDMVRTGSSAYGLLSAPEPAANIVELRELLGILSGRHTLMINSATFDQMVSSGHLQLIRNTQLRDRLVRYFDTMERMERIAEKNNRDLIDYVYTPFLMRAGISVGADTFRARAEEIINDNLNTKYSPPVDNVLLQPPDADSWNDIRRNVLFRTRISAVGLALAEDILQQTDDIAQALASELDGGAS